MNIHKYTYLYIYTYMYIYTYIYMYVCIYTCRAAAVAAAAAWMPACVGGSRSWLRASSARSVDRRTGYLVWKVSSAVMLQPLPRRWDSKRPSRWKLAFWMIVQGLIPKVWFEKRLRRLRLSRIVNTKKRFLVNANSSQRY